MNFVKVSFKNVASIKRFIANITLEGPLAMLAFYMAVQVSFGSKTGIANVANGDNLWTETRSIVDFLGQWIRVFRLCRLASLMCSEQLQNKTFVTT